MKTSLCSVCNPSQDGTGVTDACPRLPGLESQIKGNTPAVDISDCILCEICIELAPHAFVINDAGFVEVLERDDYSDEDIHEAIKNCPKDCITRE